MDALADLFIDRGDSSDVVAEARRLLEREAEDLVEEIERLTTFFDEEERAVGNWLTVAEDVATTKARRERRREEMIEIF